MENVLISITVGKSIKDGKMNVFLFVCLMIISFQNEKGVAQQQYVFNSRYLNTTDTIWVFAPENKKINSSLFLLHGYGGDYSQWNNISNLQAVADSTGILLICPDGLRDSWYFDSKKSNDPIKFTAFFIQQLIPFIDSAYSIRHLPRYIGGLSMGGYGAFYIYLSSPQLFKAAFSSSGAFDFSQPVMRRFGIEKRLGSFSDNEALWEEMSMVNQIQGIVPWYNYRFYMDCGFDDPFLDANRQVHKQLKSELCENVLMMITGGHNRHYWKQSIMIYINIIKSDMI